MSVYWTFELSYKISLEGFIYQPIGAGKELYSWEKIINNEYFDERFKKYKYILTKKFTYEDWIRSWELDYS